MEVRTDWTAISGVLIGVGMCATVNRIGWSFPAQLLYEQEQIGATNDRLLLNCLAHTFPAAFPQLFYVAYGWRAEQPLVLAGEVRSIAVPHTGTREYKR